MGKRLMMAAVAACMAVTLAVAQRADMEKLSPMLRQMVGQEGGGRRLSPGKMPQGVAANDRRVCAFVRLSADGESTLATHGCRTLAQFGDLFIADIPVARLAELSACHNVERIEARESHSLLLDTTIAKTGVEAIYEGRGLQQAYTGRGVVMGVQDIGFDLTQPNFWDAGMNELRIRRFWDHLSADTIGSELYVGRDYTTQEEILAYQHSRDGLQQFHGNHTLGIAAGSGMGTPYRGIAWESDICLVSNAVTDDLEFIAEEDRYKYTSATDVLGFKYIFDYAESVGQPCVISFSEGSHQDFIGDDILFYAALDSLVGPGRILVASAGNEGHYGTHILKPVGMESFGTCITNGPNNAYFTMRATGDFDLAIRFHIDPDLPTEWRIHSADVIAEADSLVEDTLLLDDGIYVVKVAGYPSCYRPEQMAFEVFVQVAQRNFGYSVPVEVVMEGKDAEVEMFRGTGQFKRIDRLSFDEYVGDHTHSIYSPGSAPCVVCVGASAYRTGFYNKDDYYRKGDWGQGGEVARFSSVGPTFDDRVKPDVVANGANVISSASSFYYEAHPPTSKMSAYVMLSEHDGRIYPWMAETGTSMSTPAVAGTVALWLQARPTLTPDEVKDVLAHTCRQLDATLSYPNNWYGHGEIDAYHGLLYLLGLSGIESIERENPRDVRFHVADDGRLVVETDRPLGHDARLRLYSTAGLLMMTDPMMAGESRHEMPLTSLPHGVYAVQIDSPERGIHGSMLVRY